MNKRAQTLIIGLSLAVAYLIGCATARYVPQTSAQTAPPGTHRWQYECVEGRNIQTITERANALGAGGWEMVGPGWEAVGVWCFKRPYL